MHHVITRETIILTMNSYARQYRVDQRLRAVRVLS